MWRWASPSSAALLVLAVATGGARAGETLEAALARLFPPPSVVVKDTLFLTEEEARRAATAAGAPLKSRIVSRHLARETRAEGARVLGYVYVDTHLVRTEQETLLIVIDPAGAVARVEVLAFDEPRDYLPSERWLEQFAGRRLDPGLRLRRGIRALSGATLSSEAATAAVRRALAVHGVVAHEEPRP